MGISGDAGTWRLPPSASPGMATIPIGQPMRPVSSSVLRVAGQADNGARRDAIERRTHEPGIIRCVRWTPGARVSCQAASTWRR